MINGLSESIFIFESLNILKELAIALRRFGTNTASVLALALKKSLTLLDREVKIFRSLSWIFAVARVIESLGTD